MSTPSSPAVPAGPSDRPATPAPPEAGTGPALVSGRAATGALVLLATVQLMVILDMTIVNVTLPTIQDSLSFTESGIAWVVNAYALPFGALLLLGGRSGDLLGRRRVFIAAGLLFGVASLIAGLATTSALLVAARGLQGVSAAFAQATALGLIVATFPAGPLRNRAVGVFAAMEGLGAAGGLLLGGMLVETLSWRWVFLVNVPIVLAVALLAPRVLPHSVPQHGRFDVAGAALVTGGLAGLVYGLTHAAEAGWSEPVTVGALAVAVVGLAGFAVQERRTSSPLMPLWVFADRNRAGAYAIQILLGAALFGMFFLLTLYLQQILGYSPLKAGAAFLPATVVMMAMAGLMSKVVLRTGVRPAVAAGTAVAALGMLWLSQLTTDSGYVTDVMLPMTVLTAGLGAVFVPVTLAAVSGAGQEHSGLVSGVSTTVMQVGGAIGIAVLATVATTATRDAASSHLADEALASGFSTAFFVAAWIIAAAPPIALAALRLRPAAGDPATAH